MKKYTTFMPALMAVAMLLCSCMNKDTNDTIVAFYDDAALSSFSITYAKKVIHTTDSQGNDSTYISGDSNMSRFQFKINQFTGEITLPDSLPQGYLIDKMLCTYTTVNNGVLYISTNYDETNPGADETMVMLTTTDSIDFSYKRHLRVVSTSGNGKRDYYVSLAAHKMNPDEVQTHLTASGLPFSGATGIRTLSVDNTIYTFATDGTKTTVYTSTASDGSNWQTLASDITLDASAYNNVAILGSSLYVKSGDTIYESADGHTWNAVANDLADLSIIGMTSKQLYAVDGDRNILYSDNGSTWHADNTTDLNYMPDGDIATAYGPFSYADSIDYLLMVGKSSSLQRTMVWRRMTDYSTMTAGGSWTCMNTDAYTGGAPYDAVADYALVFYDGRFLLLDSKSSTMYESRDYGLTWDKSARYAIADGLLSAAKTSMTATANGYLWIVGSNGMVYRMCTNRATWTK